MGMVADFDVRRVKADLRADVRSALLAAAARILAEEGLAALTVRRVAEGVNASTKLVYTLFGGKEGLLEALYLDAFDGLAAELAAVAAPPPGTPLETLLLEMARAYRRYALAHPDRYAVMFGDAGARFDPSPAARRHAWGTFKTMRDTLAAARPAMGAAQADIAMRGIWAGMHGVVSLELREVLGPSGLSDALYESVLGALLRDLPPP